VDEEDLIMFTPKLQSSQFFAFIAFTLLLGCGKEDSSSNNSGDAENPALGDGDGDNAPPTTEPGNETDVTSWQGEDERPEFEGEPTLGLEVMLSDVEAVAPAGIYFQHSGPMNDYYFWTVHRLDDAGNPLDVAHTVTGAQAAHVFEEPGRYRIELEEINPESNAWGVATADLEILAFSGATHYLDAEAGNDSADGNSPATAWQSASKVQEFLESQSDQNQRFLFKRDQVFPVPAGRFVSSSSARTLRFGAYARDDGTDDAALARPEIHGQQTEEQQNSEDDVHMVFLAGEVDDVVFQDLKLAADYEYVLPPNAPETRHNYRLGAIWSDGAKDLTFLRMEITALGFGIYMQGESEDCFIQDSWVHHIQMTLAFGAVHRYSLQDSTLEYSAQSHLQYMGPNEGVIRGDLFRRSGQSVEVGRDEWHQCGIRTDSSNDFQTRRVYIARNHVLKITGSPLCIGQNSPEPSPSSDMVVEGNIFDGEAPEEGGYWDTQPILSLSSVQNSVFRNNALINLRGAVQMERMGAEFSNVQFLNNTFVSSGAGAIINFQGEGGSGDWLGIGIINNIFVDAERILDFPSDAEVQEVNFANNLLWNGDGEIYNTFGGNRSLIDEWLGPGGDNILADPVLLSREPDRADFLVPSQGSPASGAGQQQPILLDFSGALRGPSDVGAQNVAE
jgi:hypothetical protein